LNENEPIDNIIQRLDNYKLAGADAILIHCNKNITDELLHLISLWGNQIPVILVPTTFPHVEFSEFQSYGISNIIVANQLLRAGIFHMKSYLNNLSCAKNIDDNNINISILSDVFGLQNMQEYETIDTLYRQPHV
jgi:phosphoenolpyruvate phosphomutase